MVYFSSPLIFNIFSKLDKSLISSSVVHDNLSTAEVFFTLPVLSNFVYTVSSFSNAYTGTALKIITASIKNAGTFFIFFFVMFFIFGFSFLSFIVVFIINLSNINNTDGNINITKAILIKAPLDIRVHNEPIISNFEYTPTPNVAPKKHNPLTMIDGTTDAMVILMASSFSLPLLLFVKYVVVISIA